MASQPYARRRKLYHANYESFCAEHLPAFDASPNTPFWGHVTVLLNEEPSGKDDIVLCKWNDDVQSELILMAQPDPRRHWAFGIHGPERLYGVYQAAPMHVNFPQSIWFQFDGERIGISVDNHPLITVSAEYQGTPTSPWGIAVGSNSSGQGDHAPIDFQQIILGWGTAPPPFVQRELLGLRPSAYTGAGTHFNEMPQSFQDAATHVWIADEPTGSLVALKGGVDLQPRSFDGNSPGSASPGLI